MLKIEQYYDEIFLKDCVGVPLVQINYRGTFVGDVLIDGLHISMNKNTIYITNIRNNFNNEVFMKYYGNFKIIGIYEFIVTENPLMGREIEKSPGIHKSYMSDEVNKIKFKYEKNYSTYEDFNKTNKYRKDVTSLLSYKKNDMQYYLSKNGRTNKFPSKEKKILKSLKQEVR